MKLQMTYRFGNMEVEVSGKTNVVFGTEITIQIF